MNKLVNQLKKNEQDFEFYPTTSEIISVLSRDIKKVYEEHYWRGDEIKFLDIGAGNGNVFSLLEKDKNENCYFTFFAIEKSEILLKLMDSKVRIIGTDFYQQTLIDKPMHFIFCNPPYKEYERWTEKILTEGNAKFVYMVIPSRWQENKALLKIIEQRKIKYDVIHSTDFYDSEYRKANAKVDVIRFNFRRSEDAFWVWFEQNFDIPTEENINDREKYNYEKMSSTKPKDLLPGKNIIEALEQLYKMDMEKLLSNYRAVESQDYSLMKELKIDVKTIKESLEYKITTLKNTYWKELFDNFNKITDRLIKNTRDKLLAKMMEHTSVDFTSSNAYAILIWVLKNANMYFDEQLVSVYEWMVDKDNIEKYKSNRKFVDDGWRYERMSRWDLREKETHYFLKGRKTEYRLVFETRSTFSSYRYDETNGLSNSAHNYINDIICIGKNLGFNVDQKSQDFEWEPSKQQRFTCNGGKKLFMDVRCFKNGNIHCKFNPLFLKKFNIEAGRLKGWVKTPQEASQEMEIPLEQVMEMFKGNIEIPLNSAKNLLTME